MNDRGQTLVAAAFVLPVMILLVVGGLILGLATVEDIRLERAAGDAALLPEPEARQLVESAGGTVVCYSTTGACFDDGLTVPRVQIVAEGRTWDYPTGRITPSARVTRPTPTTTTTTEGP